jgi:hypothetical protein
MARHLVALAAFFMQAEPPAFAMLEVVADLHYYRGTDPGEAIDHCGLGLLGPISRLGHELERFAAAAYHESKSLQNYSVGDQTLRPVPVRHVQQEAHAWRSSFASASIH